MLREFSVPAVAVVGADATLTDPVWDNANRFPEAVQFMRPDARTGEGESQPPSWVDVTCRQFRDEVVSLARGLIAAGIEPGQRVGLMCRTRYEWTLIDYSIWACGAVTVPIYETSSAEQVARILSDSGAVACFIETPEHGRTLDEVRAELPALGTVWEIDAGAIATLVEAGANVEVAEVERRRHSIGADDIATIIYTSGTTGRPKGCALSHRNLSFDVANSISGLTNLFNEGSRTMLFLPLAHSFARLIQVGVVYARVTMAHTADTTNLIDILRVFRPSFLLSVPRVFEKVYNGARNRAHAGGRGAIFDRAEKVAIAYSEALEQAGPGLLLSARHKLYDRLVYSKMRAALGGECYGAISGGAPLGARLGHFFRGIGITIYEGYGLTETSPSCSVNLRDFIRVGTVGRPVPGVTVRIADDGEILIQGDHVFRGYWNNPEATAQVIDADRWFATGDLGHLDQDGYLHITGRKKEIIVTAAGKNVAPNVLEDRLRAHPLISQSVVIGDRRPFIAALITIDPEAFPAWLSSMGKSSDATIESLRDDPDLRGEVKNAVDAANLAVSRAEAIREFRILPRDFSEATGDLTPSLKVKRNAVLKEYADEIAAIYGD